MPPQLPLHAEQDAQDVQDVQEEQEEQEEEQSQQPVFPCFFRTICRAITPPTIAIAAIKITTSIGCIVTPPYAYSSR